VHVEIEAEGFEEEPEKCDERDGAHLDDNRGEECAVPGWVVERKA